MITFIDDNRKRWGVEPICRVLPIAPSTYYAARKRPPSQRTVRDEYLKVEIRRVYDANFTVYGADKIWVALNRDKIKVARCSVERLMRQDGIQGARRGRKVFTTTPADAATARPADLVQRQFSAPAPNRLWLCDITYVRTWSGMIYVLEFPRFRGHFRKWDSGPTGEEPTCQRQTTIHRSSGLRRSGLPAPRASP